MRANRLISVLVSTVLVTALPALAASSADARVKRSITLDRTSSYAVTSGSKISFKGRAPRVLRGKRLSLQVKDKKNRPWRTVTSRKVKPNRTFKITARALGSGVQKWRVISKRVKNTKYRSNVVRTKVFRWYYVDDTEVLWRDWLFSLPESVRIAGKRYPRSISQWYRNMHSTAYVDFNASYACKTFKATIGVLDSSLSGTRFNFKASVDGATTNYGTMSLGGSKTVSLDVRQGFRVRVETHVLAGDGYAGWGNARVLCSKRP